jgi:hypothetical protein
VHVVEARQVEEEGAGKTFSPQPVSGVASPSSRARTALATRLVMRFTSLSLR